MLVGGCEHCLLVHLILILILEGQPILFKELHQFFGLRHSGRLYEVDWHVLDTIVSVIYLFGRLA